MLRAIAKDAGIYLSLITRFDTAEPNKSVTHATGQFGEFVTQRNGEIPLREGVTRDYLGDHSRTRVEALDTWYAISQDMLSISEPAAFRVDEAEAIFASLLDPGATEAFHQQIAKATREGWKGWEATTDLQPCWKWHKLGCKN